MTTGVTTSVATLADWCRVALADLAAQRGRIDAMNVFPVADADTGTNLVLTMEAVVKAIEELPSPDPEPKLLVPDPSPAVDLGGALRLLARAAVVGAHGNSGVILAQLFHGAAGELAGVTEFGGTDLARALAAASTAAYVAVERPVEGTMLSVIRSASAAAAYLAGASPAAVCAAAVAAGRDALATGPEHLGVLREAGVVDAGGYGLVVLLEALHGVLAGRRRREGPVAVPLRLDSAGGAVAGSRLGAPDRQGSPTGGLLSEQRAGVPSAEPARAGPVAGPGAAAAAGAGAGPAYEVGYLLDADDSAIPRLRSVLAPLGDSLVVTGGDRLWNVHVHVDEPGPAIEAGIAAGRPHRIRVVHLDPEARAHRAERALIAVAAGPGLARLFSDAGAVVIEDPPVTADRLLAAVLGTAAGEVVLLPNDPAGFEAAERTVAQARARGVRVAAVPAASQVQGLAACAVHSPAQPFDGDVSAMTAAARHTRQGAVTVARESGTTTAGPCRRGDVLGVVEGDITLLGSDVAEVGRQVLHRLLRGGGELVTVVTGAGAGEDTASRLLARLRRERPEVETVVYDGGQAEYPLLIGVE